MNRLSKTLEGIIAQTTFDTARQGEQSALKDRLMLAIIGNKGSMARKLLEERIEPWKLFQIAVRLEKTLNAYSTERTDAVEFYGGYIDELISKFGNKKGLVNSIDVMRDIISDKQTITSKTFDLYDITEQDINKWVSE